MAKNKKKSEKSKAQINAEIRAALEDGNRLSLMRAAALGQGIMARKEKQKITTCPYRGAMAEMSDWWRCGWWVEQVLTERRAAEV